MKDNTRSHPLPGLLDNPALQPLREVGSENKSQYWEFEEIRRALEEARRLGISPERLFHTPSPLRMLAKAS